MDNANSKNLQGGKIASQFFHKKIIVVIAAILILAFFAYTAFNEKPQIVGGDKDIHGCIGSAGYSWCEAKQKCLRIWEENCTTANPATP